MKDRATFTAWKWWQKERNIQVQEISNLTAACLQLGDKEQERRWDEWDFKRPFPDCAADLHCGELCLCICSLCVSIPPSICLSPWSIACISCGSLLCLLKAQLGSQNPLDWCSGASVFHRNHLVRGQRRWAPGSALASSVGGNGVGITLTTVWVWTMLWGRTSRTRLD